MIEASTVELGGKLEKRDLHVLNEITFFKNNIFILLESRLSDIMASSGFEVFTITCFIDISILKNNKWRSLKGNTNATFFSWSC